MKNVLAWIAIAIMIAVVGNTAINAVDVELSNRAKLVPTFMKEENHETNL